MYEYNRVEKRLYNSTSALNQLEGRRPSVNLSQSHINAAAVNNVKKKERKKERKEGGAHETTRHLANSFLKMQRNEMQFKMVASVRTVRKLIQYIIPLYEHVKKKGRNLERGGNKMAINKGELGEREQPAVERGGGRETYPPLISQSFTQYNKI